MTTDDLNRIHELEALLAQALTILVQVDDAVKAMKPARKTRKKMTTADMMTEYHRIRGTKPARKTAGDRHEKRSH